MHQTQSKNPGFSVLILIILVMLIGIFAFLFFKMNKEQIEKQSPSSVEQVLDDSVLKDLEVLESSDSLDAIESDLTNTDFSRLDSELPQIEQDSNSL